MKNHVKPPLGIVPERIFLEQRVIDITEAMARYANARKPIPDKWIEELQSIQWDKLYSPEEVAK